MSTNFFNNLDGIFATTSTADTAVLSCTEKIDHFTFYQYALIPAVCITLLFAMTKTRKNVLKNVLNGRPALIYPMDSLTRTSRLSYACAFGATAYLIYKIVLNRRYALDTSDYSRAATSFAILLSMLVYGLVYFPLFATLAMGSMLGYGLGALYVWMLAGVEIYQLSLCQTTAKNMVLLVFRSLPSLLCLIFLSIVFPYRVIQACRSRRYFYWKEDDTMESNTLKDIRDSYSGHHVIELLTKPEPKRTMTVVGLPTTLAVTMGALLEDNQITSWKITGEGQNTTIVLRLKPGPAKSNMAGQCTPVTTQLFRKKPPSQVNRDRRRAEERRGAALTQEEMKAREFSVENSPRLFLPTPPASHPVLQTDVFSSPKHALQESAREDGCALSDVTVLDTGGCVDQHNEIDLVAVPPTEAVEDDDCNDPLKKVEEAGYGVGVIKDYLTLEILSLVPDVLDSLKDGVLEYMEATVGLDPLPTDTSETVSIRNLLWALWWFLDITRICCIVADVVATIITLFNVLHTLSSYRANLLALYRGDHSHIPEASVYGHVTNCVNSIKYAGFQVGYIIWGYLLLYVILTIIAMALAVFITLINYEFTDWFVALLEYVWPVILVAVLVMVTQNLLCKFVFLQESGKYQSLDNRNLYFNFTYFMFFYNVFLGLVSCLLRILKAMAVGLLFLSRLDNSTLPRKFEFIDPGFKAYVGYMQIETVHTHPVVIVFSRLMLLALKNKRDREDAVAGSLLTLNEDADKTVPAKNDTAMTTNINSLKQTDSFHKLLEQEEKRYRRSLKARTNWQVAYTLLHNPDIRITRKGFVQMLRRAKELGVRIPISDRHEDVDLEQLQSNLENAENEQPVKNTADVETGTGAQAPQSTDIQKTPKAEKPSKTQPAEVTVRDEQEKKTEKAKNGGIRERKNPSSPKSDSSDRMTPVNM